MGKVFSAEFPLNPVRVAIVVARFNETITTRLLEGAQEALKAHAPAGSDCDVYWVPGAFEIPQTAARLCNSGEYQGVLTLGALIKGGTDHYIVLAHSVGNALQQLSMTSPVPLCFGVLTCEKIEQAFDRAGGKEGNKGAETMEALLRMIG